ncbi:MAG: phage holin family protein [Lachnospiraceae bacterium]|nr:phage holin family protein [Lachnospiraceae bacterium]
MKCNSCGFEFEGGKFCPQCGAKVEEVVAEAVEAAAEPVVEAAAEPVVEAVAAAEPVAEAAAEPVVEAVQEAEPVVEAATTAAGAEAGTMPVYTDYSSYDNAEEKKGLNVLGLVAMILGILSIVLLLCGCCFGTATVVGTVFKFLLIGVRIVMSLVALILGIVGMKKRPDQKGMAIAGLVLGILGLILGGLSLILTIVGLIGKAALGGLTSTPDFQNMLEEIQDSLETY